MMYRYGIAPILFQLDPEVAHDLARNLGPLLNSAPTRALLGAASGPTDPRLEVEVSGMKFSNPLGLAAGFDKNAELVPMFAAIGFGHLELGTVTGRPQSGNPRPRIFRYKDDRALINRMGFPSVGADVLAQRLLALTRRGGYGSNGQVVLGVNIGKSKIVELDDAVEDYLYSLRSVAEYVSYIAVNVSSPNTQALRQLQEKGRLSALLGALRDGNVHRKPIFVKVAPDLTWGELDDVLECCTDAGISGVIATNTTLSRAGLSAPSSEQGGLSGEPLRLKSLEFVARVSQLVGGTMSVIGVGGVSTTRDVIAMLSAGADLVQLYTALVYEGPGLIGRLKRGLVDEMDRLGLKHITDLRSVPNGTVKSAVN